MRYIIDAFAWMAYLEGGDKGVKVNSLLTGNNEIFAIPTTISEVVSKVKRKGGNTENAYNAIINNSTIINLTPNIAKQSGLSHANIRKKIPHFGLADALILEVARKIEAKIITGDTHFKSFKEAIIL